MTMQPTLISQFHPIFDVWSVIEDWTEEHHWWLVDHPWKGGFACVSREAAEFAAGLLNSKGKSIYETSTKAAQLR